MGDPTARPRGARRALLVVAYAMQGIFAPPVFLFGVPWAMAAKLKKWCQKPSGERI